MYDLNTFLLFGKFVQQVFQKWLSVEIIAKY